jgi:hypothetical protein
LKVGREPQNRDPSVTSAFASDEESNIKGTPELSMAGKGEASSWRVMKTSEEEGSE